MDRSIAIVAIPLLVLAALVSRGGGGDSSQVALAPEDTTPPMSETEAAFDRRTRLLGRHYGEEFDARLRCGGLADATGTGCDGWQTLIVGLPDPWGSRLDWLRDTHLEALRRALEAMGWVASGFYLPGDGVSDGERPIEREPGVLLYRRSQASNGTVGQPDGDGTRIDDKTQLLLVYLVHERPTSGVYQEALRVSLQDWLRFHSGATSTPDPGARDTLRILGPVFSGSSGSYRRALEGRLDSPDLAPEPLQPCEKLASIQFISGSATNRANKTTLEGTEAFGCDPKHVVSFHATQRPDDQLLATLDSLVFRPMDMCVVAVLRETATGFGQGTAEVEEAQDSLGQRDCRRVSIPFPFNISRLQEGGPELSDPDIPIPGLGRESDRTDLSLLYRLQSPETPRAVSELSAPVVEITVRQILRTLRALSVDAVGIIATDDRDKLFLADRVKSELPDVQLFTIESNNLLLRSDYRESLQGMIVASTYPLVGAHQRWVGRGTASQPNPGNREVLVFGNDRAAGVFNAALFLLGEDGLAFEYRAEPSLCGASDSTKAELPPVWLTAVGSAGFVPLRCSLNGDTARYMFRRGAAPPGVGRVGRLDVQIPPSTLLSGASVGLAILLFVLAGWVILRPWNRVDYARSRMAGAQRRTSDSDKAASPGYLFLWRQLCGHRPAPSGIASARRNPDLTLGGSVAEREFERLKQVTLVVHWNLYVAMALATLVSALVALSMVARPGAALFRGAAPANVVTYVLLLFAALAIWVSLLRSIRPGRRWVGRSVQYAWAGWTELWRSFVGSQTQSGTGLTAEMDYPVSPIVWSLELIARTLTFLFLLGTCLCLGVYAVAFGQMNEGQFTILAQRTQNVGMGLSPAWFMCLGSAVLAAWAGWHGIRVWQLLEYTPFDDAAMSAPPGDPDAVRAHYHDVEGVVPRGWSDAWADTLMSIRNVRWRLLLLIPDTRAFGFLLFIGFMAFWVLNQFSPTLEVVSHQSPWMTRVWSWVLPAYVLSALTVTSWSIYRLYAVWEALKQALRGIEHTPLIVAFDRLPRPLARMARLSVLSFGGRTVLNRVGDSQLTQMKRLVPEGRSIELEAPGGMSEKWQKEFLASRDRVADPDFAREFEVEGRSARDGRALEDLWRVLTSRWVQEPTEDSMEELKERLAGDPRKVASIEPRQILNDRAGLWVRTAEEFLATQFIGYVDWALRQMKMLALFILTMILLSTLLFTGYPFVPQSTVNMSLLVLVAVAVGVFMTILVQLNRDELLSRMSGTEPGRVDWNRTFVTNILVFAALPIVAVLTSKFPGLRETLFAWLGPLGQAFGTF